MVRRTLRRAVGAVGFVVALAGGLTACAGDAGGANTVKWAVIIPPNWDPVQTSSHYPQYYTNLVYEPILAVTPEGKPGPGLAESWDFNRDGTELTLHLRQGNTFTDGTPVDGQAIKSFFDRALNDPESARTVDFDSVESVTADSESTATLHLKRPDYSILLRLGPKAGQVPSPAVSPAQLKQNPIGAGPYKVTEFVEGDHVYLEKNPDYWDAANIHVDRIEFHPMPGPAQAAASVTSGQYDLVNAIDTGTQRSAEGLDGVKVFSPAGNNNWYINVNLSRAPFDDPQVVKALNLAINREEFLTKAGNGIGEVATQPYQSGEVGHVPEFDNPEYNPEKAKAILAAAGHPPGSIAITIPISSANQAQAEVLQTQLQTIGIKSDIRVLQDDAISKLAFTKSKEYPLLISGTHNYLDPLETFSQQFSANGNVNVSGRQPGDFDDLLHAASATPLDTPEYEPAVQALARSSLNFGSKIYLYTYHYSYVQSTRISDFPRTPGSVSWKGVTVASGTA
ncbi:ABC transporter substrate-binding protein [Mycobacterium sp. NPDC003449]